MAHQSSTHFSNQATPQFRIRLFEMDKPTSHLLQQVHVRPGPRSTQVVTECKVDNSVYIEEHEKFQNCLLQRCPADLWPGGAYQTACPRPILVHERHQQHLRDLHDALTAAITDIVERWWTDQDACFPDRMPLEKQEEELLQVSLPAPRY